jgi:L-fuconate dehydratase
MNPTPDYSAAYVEITDGDGRSGEGLVFTIGRGNEVVVAALDALRGHVEALDLPVALADMGETYRRLVHDSPLRWLGPEKGVMHMAIGAVVNALWDLRCRIAGEPLWRHVGLLPVDEIVDLVDFRHLTDRLTVTAARDLLTVAEPGRRERAAELERDGYPAYTTTPGWLGYDDDTMVRLCREAVAAGFGQIKLKVGASLDADRRRLKIARDVVGPDVRIAVDANQCWDVAEAITWVEALAEFDPAWVEEPTSPDDIQGHAAIAAAVAPIPVATGEHLANRVLAKQFLASGAVQVLQMDATRVGGLNENVAILLLAAQAGVPVCPHAGGVGLCELVQHLAMLDFVAVSGSQDGRLIEWADHLHEHFVDPAVVRDGRYVAPTGPGTGARIRRESLVAHEFPHGSAWSADEATTR